MEEAEKQLSEYINNKLYNYAFLIKGQWGAGKSYFLKEFIKKNENSKIFINVSLNGLCSINDIDIKIIQHINTKIGKEMLKDVTFKDLKKQVNTKNISKLFNKDIPSLIVDSILDVITDKLNKNDIVLIFDDVERCNIKFKTLFAYINYYVEIQEMKVILLINESAIKKNKEEYNKIKEKIIGHSIEYIPDVKSIYLNIINNIEDINLKNFFENSVETFLLEVNSQNHLNIRTLQFIIDKFLNFYNIVLKNSEFTNDTEIIEEIYAYLIYVCISYKEGKSLYNWKELEYGYISIKEKPSFSDYKLGFKFIDEYVDKGFIDSNLILNTLRIYKESRLPNNDSFKILKNNYWEFEDITVYNYINNIKQKLIDKNYKSSNILDILLLLLKLKEYGYNININEYLDYFKEIITFDVNNNKIQFNSDMELFASTSEDIKEQYFKISNDLKIYYAKARFTRIDSLINNGNFKILFEEIKNNTNNLLDFIVNNGFFCNINMENLINRLKSKNDTALELMNFKYIFDKLIYEPIYIKNFNNEIPSIKDFLKFSKSIHIEDSISRKRALENIITNIENNTEALETNTNNN